MDEHDIEALRRNNEALQRTVESLMGVAEARQAGKVGGTSFRLFGEQLTLQHVVDQKTLALRKTLDELGQTQAQLLHAQKMEATGQLAAGVAHEINTPMQYIGDNLHFLRKALRRMLGFAEEVETIAADDSTDADTSGRLRSALSRSKLRALQERTSKSVEDALEGVESVSRIVSAMKAFSHPGTDERTPTQLNRLIETTTTVCRTEWKYVAELVLELDPSLPLVLAHGNELNQVLLNLVVNAAHAIGESRNVESEGKGVITISTAREGEYSVIRVADTGCGMPPNVVRRIFEPFFTTKEVGRGTGQGLAISHQIVSQHGGTVSVDTAPGTGTCFEIRLPSLTSEEVA